MAKKNHWVQFARNQAYKGIDPSSSESSSAMRKLLEAAGRLDGLDPKVFAGEHRNIDSQRQVMRLHVFLGHRFAEGRCFGCQKELAAAMMLRRCLRGHLLCSSAFFARQRCGLSLQLPLSSRSTIRPG
jgi:hypothetical protein